MSDSDEIYAINLSFPLSQWLSPANDVSQKRNYAYATYGMSANKHGETSQNAGINGTLLAENNLNYNVQEGYASQGWLAGSASLEYDAAYGNASLATTTAITAIIGK